ncbi:hypothetical protein F2Q69_00003443 [Brassica cretica]|uniref:Uncharacterized protein n=1 Tax=Brassica cretica TaxID=69181 RepID=A0A8S9NZS4_BRACR|nr:hypothetical protein F2Q69_00003443 [Brassica cretica]
MEISVALVTVSVAIVVVSWWTWRTLKLVWFRPKMLESYLRRQGLSGTPYTPLVGDLKINFGMTMDERSKPIKLTDDISPRVMPFPFEMLKNHGRTFFTWLGTTPTITIMDPEQIKEVFNKIYDFQKPHTFPLRNVVAKGLAKYDVLVFSPVCYSVESCPTFDVNAILTYSSIDFLNFIARVFILLVKKDGKVPHYIAVVVVEKNMVPAFHQSCSEVVGKWENSYKEGQRIFELQAELAQLMMLTYLPTKDNRRMKAASREIHVILRGIIDKRLRAREAGEAPSDDLLGILLESNSGQAKGNEMSIEDVMEECKLFYFAGQETTSVLLVWTMVMLSQHQDWQARAREEVKQVFGDIEPDTEGLNQLKV